MEEKHRGICVEMKKRELVTFTIRCGESVPVALDDSLILFFGLHGQSAVRCAGEWTVVGPSDLYAVSPFTLYRIDCPEDAGVLQLYVSPELLPMAGWKAEMAVDNKLLSGGPNSAAYIELRQRYAALFRLSVQDRASPDIAGQAIGLAALLREKFSAAGRPHTAHDAENASRLQKVLRFVHEHWQEPISLADIAAKEFLSESYLSRLFRRYLNQTFTECVVSVRLDHARRRLRDTSNSITEIAYSCGFKSTNSFIHYFGQHYGTTPGQYRKTEAEPESAGVLREDVSDWMAELLQYADTSLADKYAVQPVKKRSAHVDLRNPGVPINRPWQRLVNIGYARDGLNGEVQAQLRRAKREIGFTDIRFHGIFDDDMHIYQQQADGSPWYNFTYVDLLFDFILSIGLTPFVELSFVPSKLAKVPYRLFERCSTASMYRDRMKWEALVQGTVAHWIARYGLETVVRWRFSCFSLNYAVIQETPVTYEDYLEMFQVTHHILKELDPRLRLGGPGCFTHIMLAEDGGLRFLRDTAALGCSPDFLTVQCYPHEATIQDNEFLYFTANQQAAPSVLSEDEAFTFHFLRDFRRTLERNGLDGREIILDEWTSTLWQRDLSGDTCYRAAWMVKNALQCCNEADMLGYWLLTDLIDEWQVPGGVFHGGYGLFTANGIPKAAYRALRLLTRTGTEKLGEGKNWFVSHSGTEIQVFLYHYCHYDNLYRYRYQKLKNPHDAYKVFQDMGDLEISLSLAGLQPGSYRWERHIISRSTGSAYDKWLEIGAPETMRPDDLKYLADTSQPAYEVSERNTDGTLQIESRLHPHEVQIIILQKRDC